MSKINIPTEEAFARASAALKKRSSGLDQVRNNILCNYAQEFSIHEFFILDSSETSFRAYVFFENEKDRKKACRTGVTEDIENCVYEELEAAARGSKENLDVAFEFDSHENVKNDYEGDYFNRLR